MVRIPEAGRNISRTEAVVKPAPGCNDRNRPSMNRSYAILPRKDTGKESFPGR